MIYGGILAGGKGTRMGYTEMPKQFLMLGGKPIIIHTLEKFLMNSRFQRIYVGCVADWVKHTQDIIGKYIGPCERISVCAGGADRNGTIMSIIAAIQADFGKNDDDIVVTHDAVRPFISHRIIEDNIEAALACGACDTIVPAADTIVCSDDGEYLESIPNRARMYQGQTPQSFNIRLLEENYAALSEEEKHILTDACKICVLRGNKVKIVLGETFNMKITTLYDLKIAEAILKGDVAGD